MSYKADTYSPIVQINLVTDDDKREVLWISRTGLDEEFISPAIQSLESVWHGDIKHKNTTICSSVERHS